MVKLTNCKIVSGLIALLLVFGCTSPEATEEAKAMPYFSLKNYFGDLEQQFSEQNMRLEKSVVLNGESEKKMLEEVNWQSELAVFVTSDINKSAWRDKYHIEHDSNDNGLFIVNYTALDDKLRTRKIVLTYHPNQEYPAKIQIINHTENVIYKTHETLTFIANQSYTIENRQNVRFMGSDEFKIVGKIVPQ